MQILIIGDSITWGAGDLDGGGWVDRLRRDRDLYEKQFRFTNLGVSGDNTYDLLERVETEIKARESDSVFFAIGINDSQYVDSSKSHRVKLDQFKINLDKLHKIASQYAKKIIFVGLYNVDEEKTCPIPWNTDKSYFNKSIGEYNLALNEFCKENKADFISIDSLIEKEDLEDGLHPNSEGHKKIFQKVKDYFINQKNE